MNNTDNIIEIEHLSKSFGRIKAVSDLSFRVKRGELFAFLGLNGAGKSTTISVMCGQLSKDSGTVKINGIDTDKFPSEFKSEIGVVFQNSVLDKPLTVRDNLKSRAALYGIFGKAADERISELSNILEFRELLDRTVGRLSGGQRRRIDIARALVHEPKILILDEPTTGLDPQTRKLLWNVTEKLRKERGMTVFLTTHYMEEAADADYIVILDNGKKAAEGTPIELKNRYTGDFITLYGIDDEEAKRLCLPYKKFNGAYRIEVKDTSSATGLILKNPEIFRDYEIIKGKMDDVFLAVTGKNPEDNSGGEGK